MKTIYVLEESANYQSMDVLFLTKEEAVEYATRCRNYYSGNGTAWHGDLYKVPATNELDDDLYDYDLEDGTLLQTFIS